MDLIGGEGDWREEPVKIVAAFRIGSVQRTKDTASVEVEYNLRGSLTGALETDQLVVENGSETVKFPLFRVRGAWKIKPFELAPHVSVDALRKHVRGIMESDEKMGDVRRRETLQKLLAKLGSLDG